VHRDPVARGTFAGVPYDRWVADLDSKYRLGLEARLEGGEELRGICVASQQKGLFAGGSVAIGVTDRRLLVQSLDRRGNPDGEPLSITPDRIASAKAGGAGGGWPTPEAAIADYVARRLEIRTTDGEKLKLMLMPADGKLLSKLGGGESQRRGVEALAEWFSRISPR
jgi:hypothetical protein